AVRHQAQSSKSAPATPTALPNVPHHESLSCARADHDWIRLAPDAGPRHLSGTFPVCTRRFPVSFQRSPDRLPILGRGFHHRFLVSLLHQPLRKQLQLLGVATVPPSLKLVFVVDFDVSHNYGQLLLMYIDSRYPIWHRLPPGGSGERAADFIKQGLGL